MVIECSARQLIRGAKTERARIVRDEKFGTYYIDGKGDVHICNYRHGLPQERVVRHELIRD